jgi:hypothetical protein
MLRRINVLFNALLVLPLLLTSCQPEEPAPVPASPYLTKIFKNGAISREIVYDGTRPVKTLSYHNDQVIRTETISYNAAGNVSLISVRSTTNPHAEEDQTFIYNGDGLVTKLELRAANNVRYLRSGEGTMTTGELFAYTTYEYNSKKELIKSSDYVKYPPSSDWPETADFAQPIYYMTYEYDAAGNPVKKTGHTPHPLLMENGEEMIETSTFTYDTQKNPYFYSALSEGAIFNPRVSKHNVLTKRTTSNHPGLDGYHFDFTCEYDANGFPTKRTMVEGGAYLEENRTVVYTYEYQTRN